MGIITNTNLLLNGIKLWRAPVGSNSLPLHRLHFGNCSLFKRFNSLLFFLLSTTNNNRSSNIPFHLQVAHASDDFDGMFYACVIISQLLLLSHFIILFDAIHHNDDEGIRTLLFTTDTGNIILYMAALIRPFPQKQNNCSFEIFPASGRSTKRYLRLRAINRPLLIVQKKLQHFNTGECKLIGGDLKMNAHRAITPSESKKMVHDYEFMAQNLHELAHPL